MNQANVILSYKNEAGETILSNEVLTYDHTFNFEHEAIPVGTTNAEIQIAFDVANLKGFAASIKKSKGEGSDLTATATLKTNSTSDTAVSGTNDIFTLAPSAGKGWSPAMGTCPITADVTKFYFTNDGTAKVDLQIRAILDSTPTLSE